MVEVAVTKSIFSFFDLSKYRPFHLFNYYYVNYSTWIGAAWPLGCITLFVFYNGTAFINWFKVGITQDHFLYQTPGDFSTYLPAAARIRFYDSGTSDTSLAYRNDSVAYLSWQHCVSNTTGNLDYTCTTVLSGDSLYCDHDRVNDICPPPNHAMQASETDQANYQFLKLVLTRHASQAADATFKDTMNRMYAEIYTPVENEFTDRAFREKFRVMQDERSKSLWLNTDVLSAPKVMFLPRVLEILPSYFGSSEQVKWSVMHAIEETYEDADTHILLEMTFANTNLSLTTRYVSELFLQVVAQIGMLMCGMWVGNFIIQRINVLSFFKLADDSWYVPDFGIRKILGANRRLEPKEYEAQLMYTLSFGMTRRFGVQTAHFYQWFNEKGQRFHREHTQQVVDDVQKFLMAKRIKGFTNEEVKVNRKVEAHYDIRTVNTKREDLIHKMEEAFMNRRLDEDEHDFYTGKADDIKSRSQTIREVENTLKLIQFHDELRKIESAVTHRYPEVVKSQQLGERMQLNARSAEFSMGPMISQAEKVRRKKAKDKRRQEERESGLGAGKDVASLQGYGFA